MNKELIKKAGLQLIEDEGLRLKPYLCPANKLTVGVGRNLEDTGISKTEAMFLLENDIKASIHGLSTFIFPEFETYSINRKVALINMIFNLGPKGFRSFKKMISAIKSGNWERAASEAINSKWYTQVKSRADRIVNLLLSG